MCFLIEFNGRFLKLIFIDYVNYWDEVFSENN